MSESEEIQEQMNAMGARAKKAARAMASVESQKKDKALQRAAEIILAQKDFILKINAREVKAAENRGVSPAFVDRMTLTSPRIDDIAGALRDIARLDDPIGKSIQKWSRPNGLEIERVRTPIGVIAIIYESRPNVTVDAGAICLKAGNAAILRGGSECIGTSKALFDCLAQGVVESGLPEEAVQFVDTTDRAAVGAILSGLEGNVDLVIPRGGKSLVARVQSEARAPVLSHLDGICHVYVDGAADPIKAVDIVVNSKMRRTGICGAAETILIDKKVVEELWPEISSGLRAAGCEIRGDEELQKIDPEIRKATDEDWRTEYLAPIISARIVRGIDGALAHLESYSSNHTETIITENVDAASKFLREADSAIVLHNASTQFADGGEFGLGAEIGIATGRLHARGPVGVEELTTYKNVVRGDGHVRP